MKYITSFLLILSLGVAVYLWTQKPELFKDLIPTQQEPVKQVEKTKTTLNASDSSAKAKEPSDVNTMSNTTVPSKEEKEAETIITDFILKPEWSPEQMPADFTPGTLVDINLGHSPENFVQAVCFQLTGNLLVEEEVKIWTSQMEQNPKLRRIDIAVKIAEALGLNPKYTYSDPWVTQPHFMTTPDKKVKRDLGAVFMYFFNCPGGVNGKMSWANNHAPGMDKPSDFYKVTPECNGYYTPKNNSGFWYSELLDARYAGLQFVLLNTYGHDLSNGSMEMLNIALQEIDKLNLDKTVKIGLFDDTWSWGKPYFAKVWENIPDMNNVEEAAHLIFDNKWKPFFKNVPRKHWYLYKDRPLVYFYNGGTVKNKNNSAPVMKRLKELFQEEFGVEPFICLDSAFIGKGSEEVIDQKYQWFNLSKDVPGATTKMKETTLTHTMVRWDSTSRENKNIETAAHAGDKIYKDDDILIHFLNDTKDVDLTVIATWNDLGEGTGINRCYDYYWGGEWKRPTHFMELIRKSQEGETLSEN